MLNTNVRFIFIKTAELLINSGIWALETNYLASSAPCKAKAQALYGLTFTALDYGFIWFNSHLDFVAQNTIKRPA